MVGREDGAGHLPLRIRHVTVSALLGFFGLAFGRAVFESAGQKMEAVAGILLIGFGLAYGAWGLKRAAGRRAPVSRG